MNGNSLGVVLSPEGLAGAERSEGSPFEPQRSAAAAKVGATRVRRLCRPDSEVVAKAKRRSFPPSTRSVFCREADAAAATPGGVGALLRREGLYSSHLVELAAGTRQAGIFQALKPRKRGRKSERDPLADENEKLRRQVGQLTEKLRKAEIIIDVQKKVAALLGRPIPEADPEEKLLMAAVTELATTAGIQRGLPGAGSAAIFLLPQTSSRFFGFAGFPAAAGPGVCAPQGTANGAGLLARRTFSGSLSSRCLCDVAR